MQIQKVKICIFRNIVNTLSRAVRPVVLPGGNLSCRTMIDAASEGNSG